MNETVTTRNKDIKIELTKNKNNILLNYYAVSSLRRLHLKSNSDKNAMETLSGFISAYPLDWDIQYRIHVTQRMFQRNITDEEVLAIVASGQIIEKYDEDFPFPSVLLNGLTSTGRPLHVVAGIDATERRIFIITVYQPDPLRWADNFTRRPA